MQKASAKKIIDLIYRDFKPADSNWVGDAYDMIGEAIEGIGYHVGFEPWYKELTTVNYRVKYPSFLHEISFIEFNGKRLPLGADLTMSNIGRNAEDTVQIDAERFSRLEKISNQWQALEDAKEVLGNVGDISKLFIEFQKYLYDERVA